MCCRWWRSKTLACPNRPFSFLYLMSFVISFGLVKGMLNFVAGRLSERIGRKPVLVHRITAPNAYLANPHHPA